MNDALKFSFVGKSVSNPSNYRSVDLIVWPWLILRILLVFNVRAYKITRNRKSRTADLTN